MKITHPDVYYCERNHFKCRILHSRYSWAKTSNKSLQKVKSCSSEIDTDLIPRQVETFDKFLDRKCTPSLHRSPTTTEEVCIKKFSKLIDSLQNKYGKPTSSSHRVMVASLDTIFVDIPPFEDAGHVQSFSSCRYCLRHRTRTVFLPNPPLPLPLRSVDPSGTSRSTVPNMSLQQKMIVTRHQSLPNSNNVSPNYPKYENDSNPDSLVSDSENESFGQYSHSCDESREIYEDF